MGILQRLNEEPKKSIKTLNTALGIAKKIDNPLFIEIIDIELNICDIKESLNILEGYIEETDDLSTKAYIHFNIYKHSNNKNSKKISEKNYRKLYKKNKKFAYKYYLNKLK